MTTLANRPNTALLVVDVQNGVVDGAYERDTVVANIDRLVGRRGRSVFRWSGFGIPMKNSDGAAMPGRSLPN